MEPGGAEHGGVNAVAFQTAVAKDLPGFHPGEVVLGTGADLLVGPVVFLFPVREFLALAATVRNDQSGALMADVGDGHRVAGGGLGAGFFPAAGVVPVARHGPADHHDQAGVGVDDDLVGRGTTVVLRLLSDGVVPSGYQRAVDGEDGVLTEPPAWLHGEHRPSEHSLRLAVGCRSMTSALPDGPASSPPTPRPETSAEERDDDALIEKLRVRAWDPGLRFDMEHMAELYADAPPGRCSPRSPWPRLSTLRAESDDHCPGCSGASTPRSPTGASDPRAA